MEFFPNRPDNLSVEGVARSFKGFLGLETGLPEYSIEESGEKVFVSKEVEEIRPYIRFAKIEGVDFSGDKIKYVMDFQENLHWVIGRDRKKVAIGIHNADVVEAPYYYIATEKDKHAFVPLEMDEAVTPGDILNKNQKGEKYAHLIWSIISGGVRIEGIRAGCGRVGQPHPFAGHEGGHSFGNRRDPSAELADQRDPGGVYERNPY